MHFFSVKSLSINSVFSQKKLFLQLNIWFCVLQSEMKPPPSPRTTTPRLLPRRTNAWRDDCQWVTVTRLTEEPNNCVLCDVRPAGAGRGLMSSKAIHSSVFRTNCEITPCWLFLLQSPSWNMHLWQCGKFHIFHLFGTGRVKFLFLFFSIAWVYSDSDSVKHDACKPLHHPSNYHLKPGL